MVPVPPFHSSIVPYRQGAVNLVPECGTRAPRGAGANRLCRRAPMGVAAGVDPATVGPSRPRQAPCSYGPRDPRCRGGTRLWHAGPVGAVDVPDRVRHLRGRLGLAPGALRHRPPGPQCQRDRPSRHLSRAGRPGALARSPDNRRRGHVSGRSSHIRRGDGADLVAARSRRRRLPPACVAMPVLCAFVRVERDQ
jgi:hypothetical protein